MLKYVAYWVVKDVEKKKAGEGDRGCRGGAGGLHREVGASW